MRGDALVPVRVRTGGDPVDVPRRTERALLVVLALRAGHVVPVEALSEAVWGDARPATTIRSLRSHLSRLRHRLGPDVAQPVPGGYLMDLQPDCTDVGLLQALIRAGRAALENRDLAGAWERFAEGESLWRGQPLTDIADGPTKLAELEWLRDLWWQAAAHWFPSRALHALGERFDHEVEFGRTLSPEAAIGLASE